ncbi:MAG TPA: Crp/Fnr family transcriptional regulator [Dehalococcoidia bacterium]|jgi:CRP/FNR family transcriptional regulator|nr:Crp/Fnr family transcriptional regulator [Dehalococcoidia bacterium]
MVVSHHYDLLESLPCFAGLGPEAIEWLLSCAKELSFGKGEIIILQGEKCPGLFLVKSGSVKLFRASPQGEEQIMYIVRRGGCFECVPLFDGGPSPVTAEALEASEVLLIPASDFWAMFDAHPQALLDIIRILAMRLRFFLNTVEDFSFRRVYSRLAKLLLQSSEQSGEALTAPVHQLNQEQLACVLGCSRQVVNNSLRRMAKNGLIKMEGRRIIVLKPEALRKIS